MMVQVGPRGDWVKYSYSDPVVLISECDGVRIVSNSKCEFLHRVPKSTVRVHAWCWLMLGRRTCSRLVRWSRLRSCTTQWSSTRARVPRPMSTFGTSKPGQLWWRQWMAALTLLCTNSILRSSGACAAQPSPPSGCRRLLKAAAYGKCFCEYYNADNFVENCKTLRCDLAGWCDVCWCLA